MVKILFKILVNILVKILVNILVIFCSLFVNFLFTFCPTPLGELEETINKSRKSGKNYTYGQTVSNFGDVPHLATPMVFAKCIFVPGVLF